MDPNHEKALDALNGINKNLNVSKLYEDLKALVEYLHDSEQLLIVAIERAQGSTNTPVLPKTGEAEFGWLPYLFEHIHDKDSKDKLVVAFQTQSKKVFGKYSSALEVVARYHNPPGQKAATAN